MTSLILVVRVIVCSITYTDPARWILHVYNIHQYRRQFLSNISIKSSPNNNIDFYYPLKVLLSSLKMNKIKCKRKLRRKNKSFSTWRTNNKREPRHRDRGEPSQIKTSIVNNSILFPFVTENKHLNIGVKRSVIFFILLNYYFHMFLNVKVEYDKESKLLFFLYFSNLIQNSVNSYFSEQSVGSALFIYSLLPLFLKDFNSDVWESPRP